MARFDEEHQKQILDWMNDGDVDIDDVYDLIILLRSQRQGHCRDCSFYVNGDGPDGLPVTYCKHPKLISDWADKDYLAGDALVFEDVSGNGAFQPGPDFGCNHFTAKEEE